MELAGGEAPITGLTTRNLQAAAILAVSAAVPASGPTAPATLAAAWQRLERLAALAEDLGDGGEGLTVAPAGPPLLRPAVPGRPR